MNQETAHTIGQTSADLILGGAASTGTIMIGNYLHETLAIATGAVFLATGIMRFVREFKRGKVNRNDKRK